MDQILAEALEAVKPSRGDPVLAYFEYHHRRYQFTLQKVAAVAAGRSLRILDVGCYPTFMSDALRELGHTVFGASSEHESVAKPDVEILNIESEPFPWDDGLFDLVIFAEVVEHLIQSPVPPLREMWRTTAAGGHLFISTPNIASARHRLHLLAGRTIMFPLDDYFRDGGGGGTPYGRHNREYTLKELAELTRRTGWETIDAGYVMAYPLAFIQTGGWRRKLALPIKVAAHRLIPEAEDTIYVVGQKAST